MSDFRTPLYTSFINRRTGATIDSIPVLNRVTLNKDIRTMTDTFDFDISYRLSEKIDLRSHDFVEFYFIIDDAKFQVGCGFVEDFVKRTSASSHNFQANGRDFLGQLFNLPFLEAKRYDQTSLQKFAFKCIENAYLPEYLALKGINASRAVVNDGAYTGPLLVPELSDAKIAPVLQQTADETFNIVYQNRFGQMVLWGRGSLNNLDTGLTLNELGDVNVKDFTLRQNYSKVFSEVKVLYTGAEANIDFANTPSKRIANLDKRARQIFQPEIRSFQTGTLITYSGKVSVNDAKDMLAASLLRKSNQNLYQVVIQTSTPFFIAGDGSKVPYEVNQLWTIRSESHDLNEKMRLAGVSYTQDDSNLNVQLLFIPKDSLV